MTQLRKSIVLAILMHDPVKTRLRHKMHGRTRNYFRPLNSDELIRNNSVMSPVAAAANVRGLYT